MPYNHPAAVYCDPHTGLCSLIVASQVAAFLRQVSHKVFNVLANHKDPLAWSCHSIHVTAANLLHHAKFSDSCKKNHLCWCSDTILMYLRNTFYTADQHTNAITLGLDPPIRRLVRPLEPHKTLLRTGVV